ncbi:hypothetical protein ALO_18712 [Acetonema longum DSM 6540]|uniref:Uncharacterized protein n=2 Tax=Acetonema TaxID=2373 RepID=F7NNQ1_9FIRM|nr:hypothetical protein ALO_18712 [Acetonema longum DSM 6540]
MAMRTVTEQPTPQEETMTVNRAHYEALQAENAQLNQKVNWLMANAPGTP